MTKTAFRTADVVSLFPQGLGTGIEVLTADGVLPVDYLGIGDRIVTRDGLRVLRGVTCRTLTDAAMVSVGTDMLGVGRPAADILLSPGQPVLIRDWRARVLFGAPTAMVPASRLVDGQSVRRVVVPDLRLFLLHFDRPEVIYASGLELGCIPEPVAA